MNEDLLISVRLTPKYVFNMNSHALSSIFNEGKDQKKCSKKVNKTYDFLVSIKQ